eukprot:TRINITY_DN6049_c0_g1_i1.p1 TRINITY_DN6049_c0_g1~~TRINITY_DN6049_c0_g1_i1.p1  ORF type:complete len:708 (+),score=115.59 TRINITY_DN6049_c0_g1_i1:68-2191(+)
MDEILKGRMAMLRTNDLRVILRAFKLADLHSDKDSIMSQINRKFQDILNMYSSGRLSAANFDNVKQFLIQPSKATLNPAVATMIANYRPSSSSTQDNTDTYLPRGGGGGGPTSYTASSSSSKSKAPSSFASSSSSSSLPSPSSGDPVHNYPPSDSPFMFPVENLGEVKRSESLEPRARPRLLTFTVTLPETTNVKVKNETHKIILRCFEWKGGRVSGPHAWPAEPLVSVNGANVNLGLKKTQPNKPVNKNPDKVLDVSRLLRSGRNTIDLTTPSLGKAVVLQLMQLVSLDTVLRQVPTLSYQESFKKIVDSFHQGQDDVEQLHSIVSLLCPLGKNRMRLPARATTCRHIQTFDLNNYLSMNQRVSTWKCPHCSQRAEFKDLFIDEYFVRVLNEVSEVNNEVTIDPHGVYQVYTKPDTGGLTQVKPEPRDNGEAGLGAPSIGDTRLAQGKGKQPAEVVLLDSDDEGPEPKRKKLSIPNLSTTPLSTSYNHTRNGSFSTPPTPSPSPSPSFSFSTSDDNRASISADSPLPNIPPYVPLSLSIGSSSQPFTPPSSQSDLTRSSLPNLQFDADSIKNVRFTANVITPSSPEQRDYVTPPVPPDVDSLMHSSDSVSSSSPLSQPTFSFSSSPSAPTRSSSTSFTSRSAPVPTSHLPPSLTSPAIPLSGSIPSTHSPQKHNTNGSGPPQPTPPSYERKTKPDDIIVISDSEDE